MKLNYFKEFIVLAEVENYTLASKRLDILESALSRHIRTLEKELNITLFDRTSRKVSLSYYGQIFLPYAKQMAFLQQEYTRELMEAKEKHVNSISIGTTYFINDLLIDFHHYDSQTSLMIDFTDNFTLVERLLSGRCEIGFFTEPEDLTEDFMIFPYVVDFYVAVLPVTHPLAGRESIELTELAGDNFISYKTDSDGDIRLKELCRGAGFNPIIVLTADVETTITSFVRDGIGVSILLKKGISNDLPPGVCMVNIEPGAGASIYLAYRKDARLSVGAEYFIRYTQNIWIPLHSNGELS